MKKIPAVFVYDPATLGGGRGAKGSGARYMDQVTPGCEWVLAGEGEATEKLDGSACLVQGGKLFKRYDAKHGKTPPPGFVPAQPEPDPKTGHWPGWLPVGDGPDDKWHRRAWASAQEAGGIQDGTYELIGEGVQGDPYELENATLLIAHGVMFSKVALWIAALEEARPLLVGPRTFTSIASTLEQFYIEGIVFHHPDGRMAKVTRKGFGLPWGRGG